MQRYLGGESVFHCCRQSVCGLATVRRHTATRSATSGRTEASFPSSHHTASPDAASSRRLHTSPGQQVAALSKALEDAQRELREVRLQLAQQQLKQHVGEASHHDSVVNALNRLTKVDEEAQVIAADLRYTGMALQASQDRLEVELRRLLAVGLTAEEVDAAAIEAGARRYIRSNIGYRAEHVRDEVASTVDVSRSRSGVSTTSSRGST